MTTVDEVVDRTTRRPAMKRTVLLLKMFAALLAFASIIVAWDYLCLLLFGTGLWMLVVAIGIPMVAALCGAIYLDLRKKPS